jgi:GT2 family glycosyltransferase
MNASVAVVIVAYNDADALRVCLASLKRSAVSPARIFLVDNSTSGAVAAEFSGLPEVEYIPAGGNVGFSRGCNLGIARSLESGAEYTWLLNPDTEVDPECLGELLRAARAFPRAGIVGARIHYASAPAKLWYAGGRLDFLSGVGKHFTRDEAGTRETGYVTGCSMLAPNAVLRFVGGLNERIFMYQDDMEFCMRIRAAGYRLYYAPAARLAHAVGPGMDWRRYPDYYLYFSVRNRPLITRHPLYRSYLHMVAWALGAAKFLRYAFTPGVPGRGDKLRALAWGAWDSLFASGRQEKRFPRLFAPAAPR